VRDVAREIWYCTVGVVDGHKRLRKSYNFAKGQCEAVQILRM
jgi:hypothetical protein